MRRTTFITAAMATVATLAMAAPAAAQEDGGQTFNGLYISGVGGYTMQSADNRSTVEFDTDRNGAFGDTVLTGAGANAFSPGFCGGYSQSPNFADGCKGDRDRAEYYGRVGFDKRFNNIVIGALVEGGRTEATDRTTAFSSTPQSYAFSRGIDWSVAARLRAGFTPDNGGILFYATGGGAYANMKHEFRTTNTTASFTQNGEDDAWGYQAGGGVEAMVARHISVGLEYLYSDFDDKDYYVTATGGAFGTGTRMRPSDQGFNFHSVRGTVSFRF